MFRLGILLFCVALGSPISGAWAQTVVRLEWRDEARQRKIPVKIFLPSQAGPRPVVVVSHGLGGSREGLDYLGESWSRSGFLCVHLQHLGSDESIWRGSKSPVAQFQRAVKDPQSAVDRAKDASFALDEILRLNQTKTSPLWGRVNARQIGVAGHSFGAWTALAASGRGVFGDERVRACVALSAPSQALAIEKRAFANYKTPTLFLTGTRDESAIGGTNAAQRRVPFDAMSRGEAFLAIFEGATHSTFGGDLSARGGANARIHQELILSMTTLFWRAFLQDEAGAKRELENFGAVLGAQGTFERKGL